jgi:hypothetical protein
MGVSWEQIRQGALDIGNLVTNSMEAFNALAGRTSVATPTIAAPQPAAPGVTSGGTLSQSPAGFLATVPPIVWLVGGGLLLWRLGRRR